MVDLGDGASSGDVERDSESLGLEEDKGDSGMLSLTESKSFFSSFMFVE